MSLIPLAASIGLILAALNYYLYRKCRRLVLRWRSGAAAGSWIRCVKLAFLLVNAPFFVLIGLWISGMRLHQVSRVVLVGFFYPFYAWVAMLLALMLVALPAEILAGIYHGVRWLFRRSEPLPAAVLARRNFLASAAALVPATLFAISARGVYGSDDLEISPVVKVPIKDLPRAFDGLTITQISDLHTGAYIRERELAQVVDAANSVRSELIVLTGDTLDGSVDVLPTAVRGLERLRAPMGVYGILGNHDYYADRRRDAYPGCLRIIQGLQSAGVRMLRNQHAVLRLGGEELLLLGLDWTGMARGNPNLYLAEPTRQALRQTLAGATNGAPRVLLAHHPHVFFEAPDFNIALTLAGHTHGGGQVVIAEHNGRPLALGSAVFRYLSGLYREGNHFLYVNRGIGFVGLPIRIQCSPEISRFQLVRA